MAKHLFRVNLAGAFGPKGKMVTDRSDSFRISDEAISEQMNVHVLDMPLLEAKEGSISIYGRDNIIEWGDTLYVKPGLAGGDSSSPFEKMMRNLGYQKHIEPQFTLSEGGLYVFGKEFFLVSDIFRPELRKKFKKVAKNAGLDVTLYFLPSLTTRDPGHIDCDYQVIDSLRLIYGSNRIFSHDEYYRGVRKKLEGIARRHNYGLRRYVSSEEDEPTGTIDFNCENYHDIARKFNGINSIINNGKLLTSSIHPDERKYLKEKGMEVGIIPLGKVAPGAGLRCVYGEFNI